MMAETLCFVPAASSKSCLNIFDQIYEHKIFHMTTCPIIIHTKLRCPLSMEYLSERGNQEKEKLKCKMYRPGVITGNLGREELCCVVYKQGKDITQAAHTISKDRTITSALSPLHYKFHLHFNDSELQRICSTKSVR